MLATGRGHDSAVILITNFDYESITFRINHPRVLSGPDKANLGFGDVFTLYRAVPRLNSYQKVTFNPLIEVGPARIVTVPGRETVMLWLDAHAPVGKWQYRTQLEILPITTPISSVTQSKWRKRKSNAGFSIGPKVSVSLDVAADSFSDPISVNSYTFGPYYPEILC